MGTKIPTTGKYKWLTPFRGQGVLSVPSDPWDDDLYLIFENIDVDLEAFTNELADHESRIAFIEAGGAHGTTAPLTDHADISITSPVVGNILRYDGGGWYNVAAAIASQLNDLGDVNVSGMAPDDVLTWDNGAGEWVNLPNTSGAVKFSDLLAQGGGIFYLDDPSIGTPFAGNVVQKWTRKPDGSTDTTIRGLHADFLYTVGQIDAGVIDVWGADISMVAGNNLSVLTARGLGLSVTGPNTAIGLDVAALGNTASAAINFLTNSGTNRSHLHQSGGRLDITTSPSPGVPATLANPGQAGQRVTIDGYTLSRVIGNTGDPYENPIVGDLNKDGFVNFSDMVFFKLSFSADTDDAIWDRMIGRDRNGNRVYGRDSNFDGGPPVDFSDLSLIKESFNSGAGKFGAEGRSTPTVFRRRPKEQLGGVVVIFPNEAPGFEDYGRVEVEVMQGCSIGTGTLRWKSATNSFTWQGGEPRDLEGAEVEIVADINKKPIPGEQSLTYDFDLCTDGVIIDVYDFLGLSGYGDFSVSIDVIEKVDAEAPVGFNIDEFIAPSTIKIAGTTWTEQIMAPGVTFTVSGATNPANNVSYTVADYVNSNTVEVAQATIVNEGPASPATLAMDEKSIDLTTRGNDVTYYSFSNTFLYEYSLETEIASWANNEIIVINLLDEIDYYLTANVEDYFIEVVVTNRQIRLKNISGGTLTTYALNATVIGFASDPFP